MDPSPIKKLDELLTTTYPEQEYLIDRLIPEAAITILSGTAGSFKTYTLLQIAMCIANGTPLFKQFTAQQSGVLFIDEENGERLLQKRLFQLSATADLPIYFSRKMGFQASADTVGHMSRLCAERNIKLVIIDSLIRIHGGDENSSRDMSQVFRHLRGFTEKGIAVLITAHNRKQSSFNGGAGSEMRGSSDILAAVDAHVGVIRKDKWYLVFEQTKQRYDIELDPFKVKVSVGDNFAFEYLGTVKARADKSDILRTAVIELLKEHGHLIQKNLAEKLAEMDIRMNEHKLRDYLNTWVAEGLLVVLPGAGNAKPYCLSEATPNE